MISLNEYGCSCCDIDTTDKNSSFDENGICPRCRLECNERFGAWVYLQ